MIDTIFAVCLILSALFAGAIMVAAIHGDKIAQWWVFVSVCLMWSDNTWAVRDTSFLYGFLKGLLG
jgi:hypothetical protein